MHQLSYALRKIEYKNKDGSIYYKIINYTVLDGPYNTLQDFVDNYDFPVRYWCLQKYSLEKR